MRKNGIETRAAKFQHLFCGQGVFIKESLYILGQIGDIAKDP